MSKILDRYNGSIFANIGKKVSQIQEPRIPDSSTLKTVEHVSLENEKLPVLQTMKTTDVKVQDSRVLGTQKTINLETTAKPILPFNTLPIGTNQVEDLKQMSNTDLLDFSIQNIIVKPFGTILSHNSNFGNIIVKPFQSVMKLFEQISEPKPVILDNRSKLINSPIDAIVDLGFVSKVLTLNSKYDDLIDMTNTSVLSFKTRPTDLMIATSVLSFKAPDALNMPLTSVLENHSGFGNTLLMRTSSVLKYFQSTLNFRTLSVLNQQPSFGVLRDFKTKSVLVTDAMQIGTLVVKDIETVVLNLYNTTGIGDSIPTAVNFIPDINATGFTLYAPSLITQFDVTTIPLRLQPDPFIENASLEYTQFDETNIQKLGSTLEENQYTIGTTFDRNAQDIWAKQPYKTDFDITKLEANIPQPSIIYGLPNSDDPQFRAKDSSADIGKSEYDFSKSPSLFQFDFQSRNGVVNEFTNFYPDNIAPNEAQSNMSFQKYVDYQVRKTIGTSISRRKDFYTPKMYLQNPILGEREYYSLPIEYRGYTEVSERIPSIANEFQDFLTGAMVTIGSGMATTAAMEGLRILTGADFSIASVSPLGLHVVAGEMYLKLNTLDSKVQTITIGSSTIGGSLLGALGLGGATSQIAGIGVSAATALLPQSVFKSDLPEYSLMIAQILAGTKYTAAYAFYDPTVDKYSSKFGVVGLNAINWYQNDGTEAQYNPDSKKYESSDKRILDANFKLSIQQRFLTVLDNKYDGSGFEDPLSNIEKTRQGISTFLKDPVGQMFGGFDDKVGPRNSPLLGKEYQQLKVPSLAKQDSFTFGTFSEFFSTLSIHYWGGYKDSVLDAKSNKSFIGPINPDTGITGDTELNSLKTNYSDDDRNKLNNYSDSSGLSKKSITDTIKPTNLSISQYTEGGYSEALKMKLEGRNAKTLADMGIPDISTNTYIDSKNASDLIKMPIVKEDGNVGTLEFDDNDLIDFYFEDVTSSPKGESILIPFRAIIVAYSDNTSANWQTNSYVGRPDKFYIYGGYDRRISLSFQVVINSRVELLSSWRKINYLQGMCYPVAYPQSVAMTAPIMTLTIGAVVQRIFIIMNSISFDFDNTTLWELEKGAMVKGKQINYQVPLNVKINCDFNVLYDSLPISSARHFGQNQDWIDPIVYDGYIEGSSTTKLERIQKGPKEKIGTNKNTGQLKLTPVATAVSDTPKAKRIPSAAYLRLRAFIDRKK